MKQTSGFMGNGYEVRVPISEHVMEVIRYDDGGLTWRESAAEVGINLSAALLTVSIAALIDPGFGVLWTATVALALTIAPKKLGLKIFKRRPASKTVSCEPANIPPELLARYSRLRAEFNEVIEELNAVALLPAGPVDKEQMR